MRISDTLRQQLALRRAWLERCRGRAAEAASFNDSDLVLLGLIAVAFEARCVIVDDARLREQVAAARAATPDGQQALPELAEGPTAGRSLTLIALTRLREADANGLLANTDSLVLVFGWGLGWSATGLHGTSSGEETFVPASGIGPAFWRSNMQILQRGRAGDALLLLDRVRAIVNDHGLDILNLLDRIQELEIEHRTADSQPEPKVEDDAVLIAGLRRQISEMGRAAAVQQAALAAAYAELSKPAPFE